MVTERNRTLQDHTKGWTFSYVSARKSLQLPFPFGFISPLFSAPASSVIINEHADASQRTHDKFIRSSGGWEREKEREEEPSCRRWDGLKHLFGVINTLASVLAVHWCMIRKKILLVKNRLHERSQCCSAGINFSSSPTTELQGQIVHGKPFSNEAQ